MTWTQAICRVCYAKWYPDRGTPIRVLSEDTETCCNCGRATSEGIYVRADPKLVPFPRSET